MSQTSSSAFKAKHVTRSYEQTINGDPARIFDLLCPTREAEWLDGWDYTLLYSESGFAEEGCIFLSRQEGEKDTIWMITKRDVQNRKIEFVRTTPESRIARLTIVVVEKTATASTVKITYVITALCEAGNEFLEAFTTENFEAGMRFWEASMNHYLETGKKLIKS
jgi:hypothetical protein